MASLRTILASCLSTVLVLVALEGVLRLAGAGHSHHLFVTGVGAGRDLLFPNSRFAHQYYPRLLPGIPTPGRSVLFRRRKAPETYRIFVLGESTSQGFPYVATEAFPYQMGQMLTRAGIQCEVINLSMSAITSYVGLDMAREVTVLEPDLVVVYFGHNEFLGIGGSASHTRLLFRLSQLASRLRLHQVLKAWLSPALDGPQPTLLERMARVPDTPLGSAPYHATLEAYEQSLGSIVDVVTAAGAEVLVVNVARNLGGFPPFRAARARTRAERDSLAALVEGRVAAGHLVPAPTQVADALESYSYGRALSRRGQRQLAAQYLVRACDLDPLRFRASTDIRRVAQQVAAARRCLYFDAQSLVDSLSPEGVAGNEAFVDQVHPSLAIHHRLARELTGLVLRSCFAGVAVGDAYGDIQIRSTLVDRIKAASTLETLYRTDMFEELGYDNDLGQRPVFRPRGEGAGDELQEGVPRRDVEYIQSVYSQLPAAYQLHISYGAWLLKQRRPRQAFAEFEQACALNRFSVSARNNLALLYVNLGLHDRALQVVQELVETGVDDPRLWESLYRLLVLAGRQGEAQQLVDRLPEEGAVLETQVKGLRLYEF